MQVSTDPLRSRFLGLVISAGGFLSWSMAGCSTSESKVEMDPDAKQSIRASKIGDESKFVKRGKGKGGIRP